MTEADRAMMVVYSRVLGPDGVRAYARMLAEYRRTPVAFEFEALPADADEPTRADLTERILPHVAELYRAYPEAFLAPLDAPGGIDHVDDTIHLAVSDVYNAAQVDVLGRIKRRFGRYVASTEP